ncbi:MAG: Hsp20/alpha crystallin family protein [Patescibacteria group bacterium]
MNTFFEQVADDNAPEEDASYTVGTAASRERLTAKKIGKLTHPVKTLRAETPDQPGQSEEEGELTVDIYDAGDSIVIQSTIAGVKPEDVDISITDDTITIRGKREAAEEIQEDNYYYKELFWGSFARSIILPEEIEADSAEASIKHGLLTVRIPKKRRGATQKVRVKMN